MTRNEWSEAVGWLALRFEAFGWTETRIGTYYDDLKRFDASDVWSAIFSYFEGGKRYAPTSSELVKRATESVRARSYDTPNQLPAGDELTWPEYVQRVFGEVIPLAEAARREHLENGPCNWTRCPTCRPNRQVTKQTVAWV